MQRGHCSCSSAVSHFPAPERVTLTFIAHKLSLPGRQLLRACCAHLPGASLQLPTPQLSQQPVDLGPRQPLMPLGPLHPLQDLGHVPATI